MRENDNNNNKKGKERTSGGVFSEIDVRTGSMGRDSDHLKSSQRGAHASCHINLLFIINNG